MSDLLKTGNAYHLEPSELSAFRNLLLFQNIDLSTRALTIIDIYSFFTWIDRLSNCYPGSINAKHRSYYNQLFNELSNLDHMAYAYIAYRYFKYSESISELYIDSLFGIRDYWYAYLHGCTAHGILNSSMYIRAGVETPDNRHSGNSGLRRCCRIGEMILRLNSSIKSQILITIT